MGSVDVGPGINLNFNCTIQELKHRIITFCRMYINNFNCTIQELKPYRFATLSETLVFQLHHTGIKTSRYGYLPVHKFHFNCTIQELKQGDIMCIYTALKFQLHHTGIKTGVFFVNLYLITLFQLHHTGIKTS